MNEWQSVHFYPWTGRDFFTAPFKGQRVLILGESHYQWLKDEPLDQYHHLTQDCVREVLGGEFRKAFWTHIAVAFLGERPTFEQLEKFWHSVAFYNYFQQSVGFGARVRPTEEMWENSKPALSEVLERLRPDVVIVLGYALSDNLRSVSELYPLVLEGCPQGETRVLKYNGGRALMFGIRHPSSGFNGRTWHPFVLHVIEAAGALENRKSDQTLVQI